ncbi:MAG: hypothetical protein GXP32_02690 [Kiritimatiellaeota bacterium]|nr:hypothetical protein [Kiritimatiellota bacterium]
MNKLERFQAFVNFEKVDRVPRFANYVKDMRKTMTEFLGCDPIEFYDMDVPVSSLMRPPEDYVAPDYSVYFPEYEVGENGFYIDGNGCGHQGCGFHHFTEFISPLKNADTFEEIEAYPFPCNEGWSDEELRKVVAEGHAAGNVVSGHIGHMYESAWEVRGYEPFLIDLMTNRDWAEFVLEKFYENNLRNAVAAAKAGVDVLITGDDVANQNSMMFQIDLWRDVMKSRWAKVYAAAKEIKPDIKIWYHSDGNIEDIIDDLIEIGVDILNPVQPECLDPVKLRKRYGRNLAFDGCMGTQTTFPFGTPDDVRAKVREWCDELDALNGGLTLSPTHVLEPEVPPENVAAFFEACDEVRQTLTI